MKTREWVKVLFIMALTLVSGRALSQAPDAFSYQAVLRGEDGCVLSSANVALRMSIRQDEIGGPVVYQEEHFTDTDAFGLIQFEVGEGVVTDSSPNQSLGTIDWGDGPYFSTVELDDGTGYTDVGGMQLISVPYALHSSTSDVANTANTVINNDDADPDPTNELIENVSLDNDSHQLTITENGQDFSVQLDEYVNDPTDEIITDFQLTGTQLSVTEAGTTHSVNFNELIPDDDWVDGPQGVYNTTDNIGVGIQVPTSTFHNTGSSAYGVMVIEDDTDVQLTDLHHYILCDNTSSACSVTLPLAATCVGRTYKITRFGDNALVGFTTINASPGDMIIGIQSINSIDSWILMDTVFVELISTGDDWYVVVEK